MTIPVRSIPTSSAEPDRPSTKLWWYSSPNAYRSEIAAATDRGFRITGPSTHSHNAVNDPKATMCASLRRTVSHAPSPESRSDCAESQKIAPISASGAGARLAVEARELTGSILLV